jgi:NDP-sugar pyrophosphorylase family protein
MNVLILAAGADRVDESGNSYPLCLTEFDGQPLIERTLNSIEALAPTKYTFCFRESDIRQYHLDDIANLIAPNSHILATKSETGGAACTALLCVEHIDNDSELLIINGNELFNLDCRAVINEFKAADADAGVVTFPSIHPRYSYVKVDGDGLVIEAAEKRPISRLATIGFYWFKHGKYFVQAAKDMIRKDASVNNLYYICPALNEMILQQKRIFTHQTASSTYTPLKNARQIMHFENTLGK